MGTNVVYREVNRQGTVSGDCVIQEDFVSVGQSN